MDYRNERDALRGRVERLEQELEEAQRELTEARRREGAAEAGGARAERERLARLEAAMPEAEALIQRLRRELAAVERMPVARRPAVQEQNAGGDEAPELKPPLVQRRWWSPLLMLAVIPAIAGGVVLVQRHRETCRKAVACCLRDHERDNGTCKFAARRCDYYLEHWSCPPEPPSTAPAASSTERARQVPAADFPVVDFDRPATIETWSATWSGRISRATGSAPPPGATCVVEATLEAASAGIRLASLTVTCGGMRLYSISSAFARARTNGAIVLKRAVARSTYVYGLRYDEAGARAMPGGSVTIDTTRGLGAVQCDTPTFRVDFTVGEWSEPLAGEPLAEHPRAEPNVPTPAAVDGGGR